VAPSSFVLKRSHLPTAGAIVCLFLAGCMGHEPLPDLRYKGATAVAAQPDLPVSVNLVTGSAHGHSLTSYALMPGGWAMPITTGSSSTGDFNAEDQADFTEALVRLLDERGLLHRAAEGEEPRARITVKFLKTEHFPEMQDYILDVLVTAQFGERERNKVYHINTMEGVNVVSRMFQNGIDGRRNAAELLLAAVVPDLEQWLADTPTVSGGKPGRDIELTIPQPYAEASAGVINFLRERYSRPSTFWVSGVGVHVVQPDGNVTVIELRWSGADSLPPFCLVDLYGEGGTTRLVVREKDPLLSAKAHVDEALKEYLANVTR